MDKTKRQTAGYKYFFSTKKTKTAQQIGVNIEDKIFI